MPDPPINGQDIQAALRLANLEFNQRECADIQPRMATQQQRYQQLRNVDLANADAPATRFSPISGTAQSASAAHQTPSAPSEHPGSETDLAFLPVTQLARLLRDKQLSSTELTTLYIERLNRLAPDLECLVSLMADRAQREAQQADTEIARGEYRGPLHGIPWGAKDLLSACGAPTTWGALPFREQIIDEDATVVQRLQDAGAVLVAKLSLGSLAWGDEWYGGKTRSPWNPTLGSSGSSAGSAAATAAGLVGFSMGSETWGSIIYPSTYCGATGLRPTFGRISRHGAMALAWSMDKLGPICRTVEDCALVFAAIYGPDGFDPTVVDKPFHWPAKLNLKQLRVGFVEQAFSTDEATETDRESLKQLAALGVNLVPLDYPDHLPINALEFIIDVEGAAAFDAFTRDRQDTLLTRQGAGSVANRFRSARLIPAVEYLRAERVRHQLCQHMATAMQDVDLYVSPSLTGNNLLLGNLTGLPAICIPNGFDADTGLPTSITFTGQMYGEDRLLAFAKVIQDATAFHRQRPPGF